MISALDSLTLQRSRGGPAPAPPSSLHPSATTGAVASSSAQYSGQGLHSTPSKSALSRSAHSILGTGGAASTSQAVQSPRLPFPTLPSNTNAGLSKTQSLLASPHSLGVSHGPALPAASPGYVAANSAGASAAAAASGSGSVSSSSSAAGFVTAASVERRLGAVRELQLLQEENATLRVQARRMTEEHQRQKHGQAELCARHDSLQQHYQSSQALVAALQAESAKSRRELALLLSSSAQGQRITELEAEVARLKAETARLKDKVDEERAGAEKVQGRMAQLDEVAARALRELAVSERLRTEAKDKAKIAALQANLSRA